MATDKLESLSLSELKALHAFCYEMSISADKDRKMWDQRLDVVEFILCDRVENCFNNEPIIR